MTSNLIYVISWWLIIQVMGWIAWPISFRLFRWLPDRGLAFSKALGLFLVTYLFWLGVSTHFLQNDLGGILAAVLGVAGLGGWLYFRGRERDGQPTAAALGQFLRQRRGLVVSLELLFTLAFIVWVALRAYAPVKIMNAGGEKFMEIAFLNGVLNSPSFPPLDPWLSGFSIAYYYFGYVMMALLTRLSGAAPTVGFELYDALLFALTLVGAFGVVFNLIPAGRKPVPGGTGREAVGASLAQPIGYGLVGAFFVAVMGNLEGALEVIQSAGIAPGLIQWLNIPDLATAPSVGSFTPSSASGWWWWRASRVLNDLNINYEPFQDLSSITEFPFFSFLLGDNHPHKLALPFVLLATGLALNLLRKRIAASQPPEPAPADDAPKSDLAEGLADGLAGAAWNPVSFAFDGDWLLFLLYALLLGGLAFLNTWDFPIYLGLTVLAFGIGDWAKARAKAWAKAPASFRDWLARLAALGVGLAAPAVLFYLLFYLSFSSQAGGIIPYIFPPTRLSQYLVIFGVFIYIVLFFLAAQMIRAIRQAGWLALTRTLGWWGLILGVGIAFFVLLFVVVSIYGVVAQASGNLIDTQAVSAALGGLSVQQAVQAVFSNRLRDPGLLLLLTALLALAFSSVAWHIRSHGAFSTARQPEDAARPGQSSATRLSPSLLFVSLLIFIGIALTLTTEFFYLRDKFGLRLNTIFKFYFQGWVMLAISSAYGLWWLLNRSARTIGALGRGIFLVGALLLILLGMVYPGLAFSTRAGGFAALPDLDGSATVARANPDDWAAIQWLRANALVEGESPPVILEAPGKSYNYEGRISAFTGLPAVLGWALHEDQWRGNYTEQGRREPDIATIYTTRDATLMLSLLDKWQVEYLVLGRVEQNYIEKLCAQPEYACNLTNALRKFDAALFPVFQSGETTIFQVP